MLVLVGPVSEWCPSVHVGTSWSGVRVVSYCTCWYWLVRCQSGVLLYMLVLVGLVSEWCHTVHVNTGWPGVSML